MSELIEQLPNPDDARRWVDEVKHGLSNVRHYLLKLRDTKAYLSLGYDSFDDMGKIEFGYEKQHLYRLAAAQEVQNSLSILKDTNIPETHLRPLSSIPEEERQAIWDEANRKAEEAGKERTAKMVEEAVKEYKNKLALAELSLRNTPDLSDYEKTIDELNAQIESLESKYKRQIDSIKTDHKELWDEKIKQAVRLEKEHDERIKGLEKALKAARGDEAINAAKKALEDEIIAGKNKQISSLENRISQHQEILNQLVSKSAELEKQHGLRIRCAKALEILNKSLMTISIELTDFQDLLNESNELLTDEELSRWNKFQTQYASGITAIDSIIGGFYLTQDAA